MSPSSANESDDKAPVLLSPQHQNPLEFLELIVKGFCPVIQDRVEVNDKASDHETDSAESDKKQKVIRSTQGAQQYTGSRLPRRHPSTEKPFELAERPPSDVVGMSMKIWEGFCTHAPCLGSSGLCKGFCNVWADHTICMDNDEMPPQGEECSVGTTESSTLTPQQSPRTSQQQHLMDDLCEEEEDENIPIAELKYKKTHRGLKVLVMTILAVYITLAILRSLSPGSINFILESKPSATPRPLVFAIRHR